MATAAKSAKKLVEKVTARVFCQLEGRGGNPVTIFAPKEALPLLSNGQREQLARTCEWESVFVEAPQMAFYMPTGEQVSFCAHAAMGGAILLRTAKRDARVAFHAATMDEEESTRATHHAIIHEDDIVSLEMNADWVQESVPHPPTLHRMLRDLHNVHKSDLTQTGTSFPTFCNSSIARKKTLVYVNSVEALHRAKPPPPATNYKSACDSIDSTGLYLYSLNSDDGSWECRQFPRASGYPEDPATGIAAAALAVSLQHSLPGQEMFKFYQGTAMGKASLILVEDLRLNVAKDNDSDTSSANNCGNKGEDDEVSEVGERSVPSYSPNKKGKVSLTLLGRVEVDDRETIEIDYDDYVEQ